MATDDSLKESSTTVQTL